MSGKAKVGSVQHFFWERASTLQPLTPSDLHALQQQGVENIELLYFVAVFGIHILACSELSIPALPNCRALLTTEQRRKITAVFTEESNARGVADTGRYFGWCAQYATARAQFWPRLWQIAGIEMPPELVALLEK